ncbi:MAG: hypothetical protein M3R37_05480 [Actinomycetota bacterium]|nr:hypothetical protein [Actinomycetota bacterium]
MSDIDAYGEEMGRFSRLNDRELDRLLAGQGSADDGDLEDLAGFVRELNVVFHEGPDGPTETRHLTAIMDAARLQPAADTPPLPRRSVWSGRTSRAARVAFASVLALGAFCGVAYAGALPGPVQGAVADVARNVGVSLPGAHNNKDDGAQNQKDDGARNNAPTDTQTNTNAGSESNGQGDQTKSNDTNQNDNNGHQNGNSGVQQGRNDSGATGDAGSNGASNSGEGSHGSVSATPQADQGSGGANQDDGSQGNGDN